MRKHTKITAAVLCVSLLLAGCGGSGAGGSVAGSGAAGGGSAAGGGAAAGTEKTKAENPLEDGVYTASAKSHGGELQVELTVTEGKMDKLQVLSHSDTPEYAQKAIDSLPAKILEAQSLGVDVISGATMTSRGILGAAAQCIRDAGGNAREYGYVPAGEIADSQPITISGLAEGERVFTGEQIKAYEPVTADTISVNASGEQTPTACKGTLLETILNDCGTSQKDYGSIIVTATDGYSIEIPADVLQARDIILAYEVNGEACDLRTVVPDERAMYWVKFIGKIELMDHVEPTAPRRLLLLEPLTAGIESEPYKYEDNMDTAVSMADILDALGQQTDFVELMSTDGWGKSDKWELVQAQYLKITGEDAPMFIGPDLPEGMRLKKTFYMVAGENGAVSAAMAQEKLGTEPFTWEGETREGVKLSEIVRETGMAEADRYSLESADKDPVTVEAGLMEQGYLCLTEEGISVYFDGGVQESVGQLTAITAEE